ncbi:MAG TPA: translation elongation factor Ts [Bacilli bacterium]|nr:translation elongation factor Ts [Bacilli bacterium]
MIMNTELIKELRDLSGAGIMDCKKALEENNNDMDAAIKWLREKGISKAAKKVDRIAAEGLSTIVIDGNKAVITELNCETDFVAKNEKFQKFLQDISKVILNSDAKTLEEAFELKYEDGKLSDGIVNITAVIGEKISLRRLKVLSKTENQVFGPYIHMGGKISVLTVLDGTDEVVAKDVAMHAAAMRPSYIRKEDVSTEELDSEKEILKEQAINEGKTPEIAEKMVMGRISKFYKDVCLEEQEFVKDNSITVAKYVENNKMKIVDMVRYEVGEGMEKRSDNFAEEVANITK